MDQHRTTAESMLQLHRAGIDLADRALSRSDRLLAATPSFDEEREASGSHIAASIERARVAAERDEPSASECTTVIMTGAAADRLTDRAMVEELTRALRVCTALLPYGNESVDLMARAAVAKAEKYLETR